MKTVSYLTPLYFDPVSYLGGGERYPLNLAKAVAASGEYEVEVVSYGDGRRVQTRRLGEGVTLTILPTDARTRGGDRLSWEIIAAVRGVDVVHIHQIFSRSSEVAMLAAKVMRKPVCVTDHGGASSLLGSSAGILELADRIVSYSSFGGSLLQTSKDVDVVAGGVDDRFFTPPPQDLPRDRLLYVGRLLPHKGIDRLLAALPADVKLCICGGVYHAEYYALLQALAADKQVEFVLDADDVAVRELYRRAFAIVLPSVYVDCYGNTQAWPELMGFSLLEGMACGAPAICSRVGGMPEYVDHGQTGYVFDELAELRDQIGRLAADPGLVRTLGVRAQERVRGAFGLASAGSAMRMIYDDLLGQARS
ncbi:MAG: glycosyltransferase family 4 protein [Solirubrobacteraceae bacterium]